MGTVARADTVDAELDRLISRRASEDGRQDPDERDELWKASVRAHNARRASEHRAAWLRYHQAQADRLRRNLGALVAHHEAEAERLMEETNERTKHGRSAIRETDNPGGAGTGAQHLGG